MGIQIFKGDSISAEMESGTTDSMRRRLIDLLNNEVMNFSPEKQSRRFLIISHGGAISELLQAIKILNDPNFDLSG